MNAACSGFLFGLDTATKYVQSRNNFVQHTLYEVIRQLLINEDELTQLFDSKSNSSDIQKRINFLYNRYEFSIIELLVYDTSVNYYSLKPGVNKTTIANYGKGCRIEEFKTTVKFNQENNTITINQPLRITSYNVCYTKLLRLMSVRTKFGAC